MPTFVKRPIPIEAVRFTGDNWAELHAFTGHRNVETEDHPHWADVFNPVGTYTMLAEEDPDIVAEVWDSLHSTHVGVKVGQWIMRGTEGEFYPCADDGTGTAPMNYEEIQ